MGKRHSVEPPSFAAAGTPPSCPRSIAGRPASQGKAALSLTALAAHAPRLPSRHWIMHWATRVPCSPRSLPFPSPSLSMGWMLLLPQVSRALQGWLSLHQPKRALSVMCVCVLAACLHRPSPLIIIIIHQSSSSSSPAIRPSIHSFIQSNTQPTNHCSHSSHPPLLGINCLLLLSSRPCFCRHAHRPPYHSPYCSPDSPSSLPPSLFASSRLAPFWCNTHSTTAPSTWSTT